MVSKLERMDFNVKNKNTAETKNVERVSIQNEEFGILKKKFTINLHTY